MRRIVNIIFFSFICFINSYSKDSAGGLLFTSSAEKVDKRTSMLIFSDKLQKIENSFNVSFDLSIWDIQQFGHIFRVIDKQKKEVEFVFVNFYGVDNMYLDFHSPITHKSVQIPITKETIEKKKLLHFDIDFDLKKDKANIVLNDSVYTCAPIGLENPSFLQFAFGLYGLNLDVPQMLIKNLKIQAGNGKSYFFPLKESSGEFAYDENGKTKARVKNPEWIVNKHYYWQRKSKFNIKNKAYLTFDEGKNRILIVNSDSILCYYPGNNKIERYALNTPVDFNIIDAIYNTSSRQCYLLGADSVALSKTSVFSNDMSVHFLNPENGRNLLHFNSFFSTTNDLYQFGGYENHTYSDKIAKFNKGELRWEDINFKGDKITPRFYSASGDGVHPDEKLIFGGFGNETGKQEHGGHNMYDLYLLNLKKQTITNLWTLHGVPKIEFIPGNNLVLSKDKTSFYAFCYAHHIPKTTGYLYRFNLKDGLYDIVSDSIKVISEDMNTSVNLFYNKQLNEFYVAVVEFLENNQTNIQIYTLLSPSITKAELENFIPSRKTNFIYILLIALITLLIVLYVYFLKQKKKKEKEHTLKTESLIVPQSNIESNKINKNSAIYLFGNFTAYNNKGKDISYRFSMKLRSLFTIIILYTHSESKISTEKLTSFLWPDKDKNEAKNIRGVTINRLRNILADIDGIALIHENSHWHFHFDNNFYCDYLEYLSILEKLKNSQSKSFDELMEKLVSIVNNGVFLPNMQDDSGVIEKYKSNEEERIETILRNYMKNLYEDKKYKEIIQLSKTYFAVDPVNDEILDICLKSYTKLGKKDEAKAFLSYYKKVFEQMTGEEYKKL
ncbi:conserved hypothetical protein [uncultured Paludibacter sp.]|nr:conserved hypothetical protein [uncultured Paludibacter sp.]